MNPQAAALKSYVEDQLDGLRGLLFRKMFGGWGIYANETFFAIIHGGKLYFHTSEKTQKWYEGKGMGCFITPGRKIALKRYFEVPADTIERPRELLRLAREAVSTVPVEK